MPRERMLEVAEHYYHFDGRSPINDQNRALVAALSRELAAHGHALPVYWGNRNWRPYLEDTLRQMQADGIRRAIVYATSAFGSYSGCRQYLEDMAGRAQASGRGAPVLEKLRTFSDHPGFIEACRRHRVQEAFDADSARAPGGCGPAIYGPQCPALDGGDQPVPAAVDGGLYPSRGGLWTIRVASGISEPERTAVAAMAGAGCSGSAAGALPAARTS